MRHGGVATAGSVAMGGIVPGTRMGRSAAGRIRGGHLEYALVIVAIVFGMQMPVVQIVDVIAVADSGVPAPGSMLVRMIMVNVMRVRHDV